MVTVTPLAARNFIELGHKEIRLAVQGGGCSGFQYSILPLADAPKKDGDKEFESNGIKVIVDPISIKYLDGAEIDFIDQLVGGGFTVKNPNAKSTCGCNQSFSVD